MQKFVIVMVVGWTSGQLWPLTVAAASDWTRFRGPNGTGVSVDSEALPVEWNASSNIKWKVDLPGPGLSSPIVVGERIFLTCWSGYGVGGDEERQENLRRHLVCVDRGTGVIRWSKEISPYLPEDEFGGMFAENGYASHSPVSDGERVYVYLGKTGAMCFDLDGNQIWQTPLGTESDPRGWGSASSPILFQDVLIVTASAESEALVGLNKRTGEQVWRQEAAGFSGTWATPVLVEVSPERTDLVIAVPEEIWAFDPLTGKLRWFCEGPPSRTVCSSVVVQGDVVYAIGGREGGSVAVRIGGEGDVTQSHLVWRNQERAGIGSPVLHEDRIYWISGGVANCIRTDNGERVYQSRLTRPGEPPAAAAAATENREGGNREGGNREGGRRGGGGGGRGQDYSSPVIADGKLYFVSRNGTANVLALGDEFKQLAANQFAEPGEEFSATPAISGGQILVRSNKRLYCIGNP